jgi:RNA polymerase sigma factor (sigma-70 family)
MSIQRRARNCLPAARQPLSRDAQRRLFSQYQNGAQTQALAKRFRCSRTGILRLIKTLRAERIAELPLNFVSNYQFSRILGTKAEQSVLGPPPEGERTSQARAPTGVPPYLASLYEIPLLTRSQETHLFRKMNYLKYKACRLRTLLDLSRPKTALMNEIERCHREAMGARNQIIRANLRLVVSIAQRYLNQQDVFFELVSDGNMSLMRAVEKFDFTRGYAFESYAARAVINGYNCTVLTEHRRRECFRTNDGQTVDLAVDGWHAQDAREADQRHAQFATILGSLNWREREIVVRSFGLRRGSKPFTLAEITSETAVTAERIRQIESRALDKLRRRAVVANIEHPV